MYEVLEIQEITEEKEIVKHKVKQILDNSANISTSGYGLMNMSRNLLSPNTIHSVNFKMNDGQFTNMPG
jgi:hypothetical protein